MALSVVETPGSSGLLLCHTLSTFQSHPMAQDGCSGASHHILISATRKKEERKKIKRQKESPSCLSSLDIFLRYSSHMKHPFKVHNSGFSENK